MGRMIRLDILLIAIWTAFWLAVFAWTFTQNFEARMLPPPPQKGEDRG